MKLASVHFDKPVHLVGLYANASMTINGRCGETMTRDGDTIRIAHEKLAAPGFVLVPWHRVLQCVPVVDDKPKPAKIERVVREQMAREGV